MKILSFNYEGQTLFGPKVKREEAVWDVVSIADYYGEEKFPRTIIDGIEAGFDFVEKIRKLVTRAEQDNLANFKYAFTSIEWLAPIPRTPKNIICVGKNYADHANEMGDAKAPEKLMIFTKASTSIAADETDVSIHSELTSQLDYEGELAIVISKTGKNIPTQLAYDHIFGYTIANDVTARDIQYGRGQYFLGKSLDESCPMGPYVVTKDEIPNPNALSIVTKVNDEVRQSSQTDKMIFNVEEIIAEVSRFITLEPGDVILTGTPAGVGKGMTPPGFIQEGDIVKVSVEGIGTLVNRFVNK